MSSSTSASPWGLLGYDIWMNILDLEVQSMAQVFDDWSEDFRNPFQSNSGIIRFPISDEPYVAIQQVSKSLKYELRKRMMARIPLMFDDPRDLHRFWGDFHKVDPALQVKVSFQKLHLIIKLSLDLETEQEMLNLIDKISQGMLPDLTELIIDFPPCSMGFGDQRATLNINDDVLVKNSASLKYLVAITKIRVKCLSILGLEDEELRTWIQGFVTGDWVSFHALPSS